MATLKVGTYILKAVPTVAKPAVSAEFDYKTYHLSANNVYSETFFDWYDLASGFNSPDTGETAIVSMTSKGSLQVDYKTYEANRGWCQFHRDEETIENRYTATDTTKLRTIIVETDQTVNDAFYTWFMANLEKPRVSVDLATAFPDKWAALTPGEHTIQIRAKNPGNYLDSDLSTAITFVKVVNWSINITATNCTADASNPNVVPSNTTAENPVILKFNKVTGYTLPASVVLDGIADDGYTWAVSSDGAVGTITIIAPTGNITGTITGVAETYNITVKGTNARKASGPSTITYGGSATLTFAYDDGYFAPTSITEVTGATGSWNQSTSTLTLTNCTGPVTVTIEGAVKTYSVTPTLTNCTWDTENATTIASNQFTPIQLDIIKNTGWTLPTEISVSGVDAEYWSWNQATGIVTISHPQGNVTVTVNAVREVYNITTNLTHATKESGPSTIAYDASATLRFSFPTGYEAPDKTAITVTGAEDFTWEKGTGTMVLLKAQGPVSIKLAGVKTTTTLDGGTYKWRDSINLREWNQDIDFTSDGASYTAMRYTGNGTAMTLQYRYGGSDWVTAYNYDEDASTGSWVNDTYKIVDLGTSAQTVTAIFKTDFIANTTKLTQLATPQNVSANGTTVSWDEVENATSYEVIEGGNNVLGTVENPVPSGYTVTLTSWDENVANDDGAAVKFNTPPTSENDYDYRTGKLYDDTGLYNASGAKVTQPIIVDGVSKVYVFKYANYGSSAGGYKLNGGSVEYGGEWNNPAVISLTENSTLSLLHAQD